MGDIEQAQAGDGDAVARLLMQYGGILRRIAGDYYLEGSDFEDLLQEARIGFLEAIRGYNPVAGNLTAFVDLCARRRVLTILKTATRKKRRPAVPVRSLEREREHSDSVDPAVPDHAGQVVAELQVRGALRAARLSPLEATVVGLALDGYTLIDIATKLGLGHKVIDNASQRARLKLRSIGSRWWPDQHGGQSANAS